ncbi:hypothetical protein HK100_008600 [Physocladia obscura]|uniref:Uncharacterized protein n=1 Tax=Physocladia obscura TaxID=109957 RepID=A0AAD5T424_9FUNG|nr:hypothetical protein HK100_008600 [Physocladia obscura]
MNETNGLNFNPGNREARVDDIDADTKTATRTVIGSDTGSRSELASILVLESVVETAVTSGDSNSLVDVAASPSQSPSITQISRNNTPRDIPATELQHQPQHQCQVQDTETSQAFHHQNSSPPSATSQYSSSVSQLSSTQVESKLPKKISSASRPKEPRFRAITDETNIESIFRSVPLPDSDENDEDYVERRVSAKFGRSRKTTLSGGSLTSVSSGSSKKKEKIKLDDSTAANNTPLQQNLKSSTCSSYSAGIFSSVTSSSIGRTKDTPSRWSDDSLNKLEAVVAEGISRAKNNDHSRHEHAAHFRMEIDDDDEASTPSRKQNQKPPPAPPTATTTTTTSTNDAVSNRRLLSDEESVTLASAVKSRDSKVGRDPQQQQQQIKNNAKRSKNSVAEKVARGDCIMVANKAIPYNAINNTDRSGRTPLFKVSGSGDLEAVTALIRAGADVNAKDNAGWSPLHEACIEGQLEVCTQLIRYGADVNALGFDNQTPLHDAAAANHYEVVELLLSHGASLTAINKEGDTPLDTADDDTMLQLLQLWKRMTVKVVEVDENGLTLLHHYAIKGDAKGVRRALKYGAEVDFACNAGWTPLHEGASKGAVEIVEVLCQYGANVNAVASSGTGDLLVSGITPLMDAAAICCSNAVRILLEFGANAEFFDSSGKRAIDYVPIGNADFAANPDVEEVIKLLKAPPITEKDLRKPDFIKTKHGSVGMMSDIRDQASAMLEENEAGLRKDSNSDTSHSTNLNGSLGSRGANISVSATTAAAVGLGGPNTFSWGGLDVREREGPFVSSREERKFNALLRTLGAKETGGFERESLSSTGANHGRENDHQQQQQQQITRPKTGSKLKKRDGIYDEVNGPRKPGRKPKIAVVSDSDDNSGRKEKSNSVGGGGNKKKHSAGLGKRERSGRDSDDANTGGKQKHARHEESDEESNNDSEEEEHRAEKTASMTAVKRIRDSSDEESRNHNTNSSKKKQVLETTTYEAAARSHLKFKKTPSDSSKPSPSEKKSFHESSSLVFDDEFIFVSKSQLGSRPPHGFTPKRDLKPNSSDEFAASHRSIKLPDTRTQLPSSTGTSTLPKKPLAVALTAQHSPSLTHISSTYSASASASTSASATHSAPSNTNQQVHSSPTKKKTKKKNGFLVGTSGYQKAGDEPPITSSQAHLFATNPGSEKAIYIKPAVPVLPATLDQHIPKPVTSSIKRRKCLPIYRINLPAPQPTAAALTIPKKAFRVPSLSSSSTTPALTNMKPYFVDLQIAFYLGRQSGRDVLEMFPGMCSDNLNGGNTARVATRAQKELLSASPVGEACLDALIERRKKSLGSAADSSDDDILARSRWIKWYERGGRRSMRLEDVDVQFLDADQVLREINSMRRQQRQKEKTDIEANDEDVQDDYDGMFEVVDLDLENFVTFVRSGSEVQTAKKVGNTAVAAAATAADAVTGFGVGDGVVVAGAFNNQQVKSNKPNATPTATTTTIHKFKKFGLAAAAAGVGDEMKM